MGGPYAEVIGDPVAHSKSPLIHRFWLERLGIDGDYGAIRVTADTLPTYLDSRRTDPHWRGCNVTMPLKRAVLPFLDTVSREAASIGAVNTVRRGEDGRLHGRNTDVHGISRSLDGLIDRQMRIVLIGAGGGARAAAQVIHGHEPREVTVINRSIERGRELLHDFHLTGEATDAIAVPAADLVINAAPPYVGFDLGGLNKGAIVFDMVYSPPGGAVLAAARARGLRVVDGLTMLVHQAGEAFSVFFQRAHPRRSDSALRELLTR